jgi:proteasome assembly chaperone (PAC2) family protein
VLLCALSGWSDAGSAASAALEYLIMKWAPRRFAEMDPGAIYVQTENRPIARVVGKGDRRLRWPSLTFYALPVPHAEHDLLLVLGPEPDLRWRTCTKTIMEFAERLDVAAVVTLGAFLAPVPHAGPVLLSGRSAGGGFKRELDALGLREGTYQGPTSFLTVLLEAAVARTLRAAAIWAASPIYLRGLPNPKLSAALLGAVERVLSVDVGVTELEVAGRDLERRIDEELRARPDLERFVRRLAGAEIDDEDLPGAEELLEDLENYLRHLRGDE